MESKTITQKLIDAILKGRALHSYLIAGADLSLSDSLAKTAASYLLYSRLDLSALKQNPNYMEFSSNVSIAQLRDEIRPELDKQVYGGNNRVVVFRNASMFSNMVQNAMLKMLEEPPKNTYFILTGNEHGLLLTIRSRCMIIRPGLSPYSDITELLCKMGATAKDGSQYAAMSGGIATRAERLYSDEDFRLFRNGAMQGFITALSGSPDYKWAKGKYERYDWIEANEMLLLACHDMMLLKCNMPPECCTDLIPQLKKLCSVFTFGDIGCIIDKLTENAMRLTTNAGGGACYDKLFAELALIRTGIGK